MIETWVGLFVILIFIGIMLRCTGCLGLIILIIACIYIPNHYSQWKKIPYDTGNSIINLFKKNGK